MTMNSIYDKDVIRSSAPILDMYLPSPPRAPINVGDYGICDAEYHSERQGLEVWRYSKTLFHWTNTGAALVLAGATEADLFVDGTGESGVDQGFPTSLKLSGGETDADRQGAFIKLMDLFEVRGLGFEVLQPYAYDLQTGKIMQYQQVLDDGGYIHELVAATYDNVYAMVTFEDSACNYIAGLIRFHPSHASMQDSIDTGKNTHNSVGMVSVAPMRPFITGARDQINQAFIALFSTNAEMQVLNNQAVPLPSAEELPEVIVPVLALAYGEKVCPPVQCAEAICDTPTAQANMFAMFQKFVAAQGGK